MKWLYFFWRYVTYRKTLGLALLGCALAVAAAELTIPWLLRLAIDTALGEIDDLRLNVLGLWMLGVIARDLFLAVRSDPRPTSDEKFILHSGLAVLVATLVVGIMEHNLGDSEVLMLFLAITACAYTARDRLRTIAQANG